MGVFFLNWISALEVPTRNLLLRTVLFILYLVLGGTVFMTLEHSNEKVEQKSFFDARERLKFTYRINDTELEKFVAEVKQALDDGAFDKDFDRWSFFGSMFFAATVVTTIGYGHIAPRTFGGRLFCIFYAFFGIPVAGLMLKSLGERMVDSIDNMVRTVDTRVMKRKEKRSTVLRTSLILFGIMLGLIFLLGAVSVPYEGWTFFEGVYFAFVTLSTIGFGDFVPTSPEGESLEHHARVLLFIVVTFVYITVGLSVVSSVLVSVSRLFENSTEWDLVPTNEEEDFHEDKSEQKKKLLDS